MSGTTVHPHILTARIYYEDTDAGGIVYHANHLKFAERGRTELLRAVGFDHHQVMAAYGLMLIVKHIEIDYRLPLKLDDLIEVRTVVNALGNSSLTMQQDIYLGDKCAAALRVVIVAINRAGRPERIPPQLRQIFTAYLAAEAVK